MPPPININALKLEGFRAYLQPQTIDLCRGNTPLSLAVFAPNAKGKSSLVDAIEFYFSEDATLKRLGKRAAYRNAGRGAIEHVDAQAIGVIPAVHIWFREGQDKFDEARPVISGGSPLPKAAKRVLAATVLPFVIRGYELRGFVEEATPEERYKEIAAWFALDPLLAIQQNLRSLRRQVKQRVESTSERNERIRDLSRITDNSVLDWDETEVCTWFNTHVLAHLDQALTLATLADTDAGYQELVKRKADEDEKVGLATLRRLVKLIEAIFKKLTAQDEEPVGTVVTYEKAVEAYGAALAKEADERIKASQAVFNELWGAAKAVFEDTEITLDACPVCDTALKSTPHGSREKVRVSLETKLEDLADYRKAENELKKAKQTLVEAVREHKASLDSLTSSLVDTEYKDKIMHITAYQEAVDGWKIGDKPPKSASALVELEALYRVINAEKKTIEERQGEHTYANALKTAKDLFQIKADIQRIESTKRELRQLHEQLNQQALAINNAIVEHTQKLIGKLRDKVNLLYKDIQGGDEDAPPIYLELPGEEEINQQRIQLLIDFSENRKGVVPSGYLSDSQIHALALSLRLAAIRLFNDRMPVIVLDDVVTSYDADHRKNIAAMLAKHFEDFQIIIVTHDEQFFCLLQDHLPRAHWKFLRIIKIEPDVGPIFHNHRTPDKIIEEKLDAGESAAVEIRQAEEEWLLDICRSFGVKVVIRPVDRAYKYDRSELADALGSFLKKHGILPPKVPGISNPFLTSLQRGVVENLGIHFPDNPSQNMSIGDEKARWREFKFFRDKFSCPKCGKRRFHRPHTLDIPVCTSCQTAFYFGSPQSSSC